MTTYIFMYICVCLYCVFICVYILIYSFILETYIAPLPQYTTTQKRFQPSHGQRRRI